MPELIERLQVGKKQDISDAISIVDAKSTPLTTMIQKGKKPINTLFEWQVDDYSEPSFGGVVSNADVTQHENAAENRQLLQGRVQIFERTPKVDRLAESNEVAGVGKSEMARSVAKKMVEIKRDQEAAFCSDNESRADNGVVGYRTRGLGAWIQNTAQTDLPVPAAYRTPAASLNNNSMATLTESMVQDVLTSIYTQTGETKTYVLLCGVDLKRRFTEFTNYQLDVASNTGTRRMNQDASTMKLISAIEFFQGDFGTLQLHPSNFLARDVATGQPTASSTRRGYVLDLDMLEMRTRKPATYRPLEDQGGGPRGLIEAVTALCVINPLGLGKFYATT